jgi:hypothetical protein
VTVAAVQPVFACASLQPVVAAAPV